MPLTALSQCESLHSIFKYVPTQGKLVIKSKRTPLFSTVSVYEPLKVPKEGWGQQPSHGIPLFTESLKPLEEMSLASLGAWETMRLKKGL